MCIQLKTVWRSFRKRFARASLCLLLIGYSSALYADTLYLTSLHWPPFSGAQLKNQGACIAIARAALEAEGHTLVVDFYPWSRAVRMASRRDSKYLGYLPEYTYPTDKFIFSLPMGRSALGIVEQKIHPISWTQQSDLNHYTIGVVKDYVNTRELDKMMALGIQPFEAVASDLHNVNKVATGRIDAAIIDEHVLQYLLAQPNMKHVRDKVQFNKKLLTYKELFIAFKNNHAGRMWRDRFNQGISKIDVQQILEKNMRQ
ncbi:ABC transporter substrate-binding protein [Shewanella schlegeliana]|uniref:ABC transporter substrate-binding protein n=1 Tax=Shewanella schlegeliana TaxID=190308 RepID=A0ABS1SYV0_9GAMM|nr:ABC transporter substrate-binding protein [Shewanella schlegeliana]MBL4913709.1 ABC transporter substrate-binding protein [Shewanella schlegeliana]MCL1111574.1 ABC transporter substrate-binding protein [Shewanella schlegeliana]